MVLVDTVQPPTSEPEASESYSTLSPSLLYCMDKREKKLIKLNTKAQECVSRKKAQKILKKADKIHLKIIND